MEPITRRTALLLGGLGAASVAVGGTGLLWMSPPLFPTTTGRQGLQEPEAIRSADGLLAVRLTATPARVRIGNAEVSAWTYNGTLPGPTLSAMPGDRIRLRLVNELPAPTNLHTHGLHVSPAGNSDNVFIHIEPGETYDYDYRLPADHPPGVFWYHPHVHGLVADQVFAGLSGAIIVGDPVDDGLGVSRDRVLLISDITYDPAGSIPVASRMERMMGREGRIVLVNGQLSPLISGKTGSRERWRVINSCPSRFLRLTLDGQRLRLLGYDSGRFISPEDVTEVVLAPGNRADLLVDMTAGASVLRTLPVDRGGMGMMGGGRSGADLAVVEVGGPPSPAAPITSTGTAPRDLRARDLDRRRTLELTMGGMGMGSGMMSFAIDGKAFDPARVDSAVKAGAVEEWTIRNPGPMDHPFHLHVWPMQVVERGDIPVDEVLWQEVVNVPAFGQVRVRIAFDHFTGRSVYHCHILDHEDNGMMGVIEVAG